MSSFAAGDYTGTKLWSRARGRARDRGAHLGVGKHVTRTDDHGPSGGVIGTPSISDTAAYCKRKTSVCTNSNLSIAPRSSSFVDMKQRNRHGHRNYNSSKDRSFD